MAIVGAVGVEVLPQVRSFNRDMRAKLMPEADKLGQDLGASMGRNMRERLGVEMRNLPKANVGLDDSAANRQITELKAKLDALGRKHETATVSVNTRDAGRSIDSLTQKINGSGGLMAGLLALAPAAVPVGAAITGAIGATLPILTAAGAGFGAFGIAVAGSVKLIEADMKSMTKATQKVATAQAAVDNAKGPVARAAAQKRLNAATAQYNALLKQMSPAERTIIKDWGQLVQRFDAWDRAVGLPAIAKVAHGLFPLLNAGFKIMTPLVKGTANALVSLEAGANRALNGAFGKKFIKFLENSAPRAILGLGHAFSNIGKGIAGIILAFAPFQHSVLGALDSVTAKFATWGTNLGSSSGFHKFIQYVRENGPQLAKLLQAAGQAVVALVKAAAGFGAGELKTMTSVLGALVKFANAHPQVAKLAVATLALAKAVQVLKLASIGGAIAKTLGAIGGAKVGGGLLGKVGGTAGAGGAGAAGASASALAPLAGAIAPLLAGAILRGVDTYVRKHSPTYGSVANRLDAKNPIGIGTGQNNVIAATFGKVFSTTLDLFFPRKAKPAPKPPNAGDVGAATNPNPHNTLPNNIPPFIDPRSHFTAPPNLPGGNVKIGVNSSAATLSILKVERALLHLPKNKNITLGSPGAKTTQRAIDNVYLAQHHLPGSRAIKLSAPGGNLSLLTLINVGRAAKGLKPVARINVSSPGAKGARQDINTLAHQAGLLPKNKNIATSARGAKGAILDLINLDRKAHGLKPVASIKAAVPGADAAVRKLISLGQKAGVLPKTKFINVSTPGAVKAYDQLNTLLHKANVLPKGKSIPTDVPGATKSILSYIQLYEKAHHLPISKSIPTSAPGGDHTIQQMIDLARKIGLIPKSHNTQINTPGYDSAHFNVISMKDALANLPKTVSIAMKVIGTASDVLGKGLGFATGGEIPGRAPHPKADNVLIRATPGEFMQQVSAVKREGVGAMEALNDGRATIVPRFANGGTVLDVNMSGPNVASMKKGIKGFLNQSGKNIGKDQEKHLQQELASLGGGGGGGNWTPVIAKALALLHQPLGLAALFSRVIAGESGGNPRAINLYDSNAKAGHPSVGLAQVIRGTFEAFAGPFRNVGPFLAGVSINPLANIYAGLNYGIQTYGSVANIPGIASELHGGGYRPYATGGPVPGSGNGDTVPAMLTPGEFVLNKGAVSKVGMGILHAINGGGGTGDGFFHAGGPVLGIHYGAVGDWVKALAIQSRQLRGAFHQSKWDSRVSTDLAGHPPKARSALSRFDPIVGRLVSYLWGRHGKATTFDDALSHFNHDRHPMAFLDIMRAYDAGKGYLTEFKGKGKGRHRFIPDSTLSPFRSGLRRYEGMYHHDVQALEHKLHFKPENGSWSSALDGPVAHVIDHALHKAHSQFLPRPWSPLNAGEKTLQQVLKSNADTAELNKDLNKFIKWGLFDLVENLSSGNQDASMLPTARAAAKNRGLATKLNAAYKVADRTTGINPLVNLGYSAVKYDQGGYIQPGHTMVINKTNKPEPVLSSDQWDTLKRGGSRPGINIEHVEVHDGSDVVAFGRQLAFTLANAGL